MRSIPLLLTSLLTIACVTGICEASKRPNVILIMTDDQGYGDLACHGNPVLATPHLDRLYGESVHLTNFHVDPTCSPTRAALMTGRYSTRTGVWHTVMGRNMPCRSEVMMPQVFAAAGYDTAIFGKWHLGDSFPFRPQDRGFGHVLIHGGGAIGQIPDYWDNDYFDDTFLLNGKPKAFTGYCTDIFFGEAIRYIEAHRDRPFFVYLPTNAPHSPYRVPESYSQVYADRVEGDEGLAKFYGMIANIDENLGRLRQRLEELKLADNTLLIFMTDNGTARGITFTDYRGNEGQRVSGYNAGMRGRKGSPYEGGHRVPCFFHWPAGGLTSPRDVDGLTAHLDMLPTLIDLCGLAAPEGVRFDGRSLGPLLLDPDYRLPDRILCAHHQEVPRPEKYRFGCVMDGKWRLVIRNDDRETPTFELFDLSADPGQTTDVSNRHEEITRRLRSAYDGWWNDIDERMDDYSRIVVGDPRQNPVRLTRFDWHSVQRWGQGSVRSGKKENGFWALDVAEAGDYEIVLRRWPEEVNQPITAAIPKGKAITADEAHLRIGALSKSLAIPEGAATVTFQVSLPKGPTQMETSLTDHGREMCGAYYASVRKLP